MAQAALDGRADHPGFTARERAAVRFADRFWHDHHAVDDELWSELEALFTPAEIIELSMSVSQNLAMGKVVAMLGIPSPDFRDHLADGAPDGPAASGQ